MNARKKLNAAYFYGALMLAAVLGSLAESWFVFLMVAAGLIAGAVYAGDIRSA